MILVVFLLRSFLFEPFKIPSGSMMPTLLVGDLILVNKFHYGVRLPVINKKIVDNHDPQRGDVMVFRFPKDPSTDYIKRVVGLPGDEVAFRNQQLFINGQQVPSTPLPPPGFYDEEARRYVPEFKEKLGTVEHGILINPQSDAVLEEPGGNQFPFRENCRYSAEGVACKVPRGQLFHDGRQPRQLARFALLGLRSGPEHRRQGIPDLDELRRPEADRVVPMRRRRSRREAEADDRRGRHASRQRGVTLFGLLFWAVIVGFVALIGMRVLPALNEYFTIKRAVNKIATEGVDGRRHPRCLREAEGHRVLDRLDHRQGPRRSPRKTTRSSYPSRTTRKWNL